MMLIIDCSPHFRAKLDGEQLVAEQRMSLMRDTGLEDSKRVFQLADALTHFGDLPMHLVRVREDEPVRARGYVAGEDGYEDTGSHLVPWPVVRLPLGQMEAHPRRLQDEQGTVLSHLSLRRRHSAQDMAPLARLSSCSWVFAVRSLFSASWRGRAESGGMGGE